MDYSKPTIKQESKQGPPLTSNFSPPPAETGDAKNMSTAALANNETRNIECQGNLNNK